MDEKWLYTNNNKFITTGTHNGGLVYKNDMKGTYSISDNKIELKFSDGKINACSFSRTENTITINGKQLTRAK